MSADNSANETAEIEIFLAADTRERPSQAEDEDGWRHGLEAPAEAVTEGIEADDAARQIQEARKHKSDERTKYERFRGIAVSKGLRNALALIDATRVKHAENAGGNEDKQRQDEIDHLAMPLVFALDLGFIGILILFRDLEMLLVGKDAFAHSREIAPRPDDEHHEDHREPCVKVERDGMQEKGKTIDGRILRQRRTDGSRPARDRRNDADRCCRRIDDIRKLSARNLELVRDWTHDRTDRQAVEIVINEDDNAEQSGQEECAARPLDGLDGPVAIGLRRAGTRDGGHEDTEDDEENKDVDVAADFIGHDLKHREDGGKDIAAREEQCSRKIPMISDI